MELDGNRHRQIIKEAKRRVGIVRGSRSKSRGRGRGRRCAKLPDADLFAGHMKREKIKQIAVGDGTHDPEMTGL